MKIKYWTLSIVREHPDVLLRPRTFAAAWVTDMVDGRR